MTGAIQLSASFLPIALLNVAARRLQLLQYIGQACWPCRRLAVLRVPTRLPRIEVCWRRLQILICTPKAGSQYRTCSGRLSDALKWSRSVSCCVVPQSVQGEDVGRGRGPAGMDEKLRSARSTEPVSAAMHIHEWSPAFCAGLMIACARTESAFGRSQLVYLQKKVPLFPPSEQQIQHWE